LLGSAAAAVLLCASAQAQTFPSKLVRIVIGLPPGGSMDVTARLLADRMREDLGQQILVENRPGASGTIAADLVAKAQADGHTMMLAGGGTLAIRHKLELKLPYDVQRDYAPVIHVANLPLVLAVPTALPVRSVKELLALARAHPGQLNFSSSGIGSTTHLSGELFKTLAKIDIVHVPYKGSSAMMSDLVAGQIHLALDQITTAGPQASAGKLKLLAVSTERRSTLAPQLPTVAEAGVPGYASYSWSGIVVPAATPKAAMAKLSQTLDAALKTPEMKQKLAAVGAEAVGGSPEQFGSFIRAESTKWSALIDKFGIKPQ
jgi:tripartite-type tricarboxylate transporter receptor subunit TctC